MTSPILIVQDQRASIKIEAVPNLLPCRIHHTGSVTPASEYWVPLQSQDLTSTAYFRGRKLRGRTVVIPKDYRGVVVERRDGAHEDSSSHVVARDQKGNARVETDALQVTARFDKVLIWSHETLDDAKCDPHVRSLSEWPQVAGKVSKLKAYEVELG